MNLGNLRHMSAFGKESNGHANNLQDVKKDIGDVEQRTSAGVKARFLCLSVCHMSAVKGCTHILCIHCFGQASPLQIDGRSNH